MVINGAIVSDLDMMFIESVLQEELSLCMMMRSARTGKFFLSSFNKLNLMFGYQIWNPTQGPLTSPLTKEEGTMGK